MRPTNVPELMESDKHRDSAEAEAFRRMDEIDLEQRRRRFRETTMAERLETAFELSDFARELREGMRRAR
jgi:hypothetical protein